MGEAVAETKRPSVEETGATAAAAEVVDPHTACRSILQPMGQRLSSCALAVALCSFLLG